MKMHSSRITPEMTGDEISLLGWATDNSSYICSLYDRFALDLISTRRHQRALYEKYMKSGAMFGDIEGEFLYLSMRDMQPSLVIEVGSGITWSTSWLLRGLYDNGHGMLHSYDLVNQTHRIPDELKPFWTFHEGDVREQTIPDGADFFLSDSDHREPFATNFMAKEFPKVRPGGRICVHDVYAIEFPAHGEAVAAFRYLNNLNIRCYSVSNCHSWYERIMSKRQEMGLGPHLIHYYDANALLIFEVP